MNEVYPLLPRVGLSDDLGVEKSTDIESPFRYVYVSEDMGGDGIPADTVGADLSGLNAFLWMSFEDIQANVNTVLKLQSDTGTYGAGDEIEVYWVYSTKANEKAK